MKKSVLSFLITLFLGFFLFSQQEREFFFREYQIGPKDLLEIKVFELQELNQTVRVSEDGSITLPLIGKVMVNGLTRDLVERKIASLLEEKYVKNAQVQVFIKEYQSKVVSVIGAVERPGIYELVGRQTLLQIISRAGGFANSPGREAGNEIIVIRQGSSGRTAKLVIDLEDLIINGNHKLNIPLMPGDIISVPVDKSIIIYVFGEVRAPGALNVKKSKKLTLLQAISQAGGPTERASQTKVVLKRKDERGKEIQIKVNLKEIIRGEKPDIPLLEGDIIFIPESVF